MGQGQSPATSPGPLVQRQSTSRTTSDGKSRQEDTGSGRGNLEHSGQEGTGHRRTTTARLQTITVETRLYPEKQRPPSAALTPDHERSSDANPLLASPRSSGGDDRRSKLLRFP